MEPKIEPTLSRFEEKRVFKPKPHQNKSEYRGERPGTFQTDKVVQSKNSGAASKSFDPVSTVKSESENHAEKSNKIEGEGEIQTKQNDGVEISANNPKTEMKSHEVAEDGAASIDKGVTTSGTSLSLTSMAVAEEEEMAPDGVRPSEARSLPDHLNSKGGEKGEKSLQSDTALQNEVKMAAVTEQQPGKNSGAQGNEEVPVQDSNEVGTNASGDSDEDHAIIRKVNAQVDHKASGENLQTTGDKNRVKSLAEMADGLYQGNDQQGKQARAQGQIRESFQENPIPSGSEVKNPSFDNPVSNQLDAASQKAGGMEMVAGNSNMQNNTAHMGSVRGANGSAKVLPDPMIDKIVRKILFTVGNQKSEVKIDLKPELLGHMRIQIVSENQQLTIKIAAESAYVKEMVENSLSQLKTEFQNHKLDIQKFDVLVGDHYQDGKEKQDRTDYGSTGGKHTAFQEKNADLDLGEESPDRAAPMVVDRRIGHVDHYV